MKIAYKNPNTYIVIAIDALLFYSSFWFAHWLRFESMDEGNIYLQYFNDMVFPIIAIKLLVFSFFGLQSGMWRYTSVVDLLNIIKASVISFGVVMIATIFYYFPDFTGKFSRSIPIIDMIITIGLISMFRLSIRLFYSNRRGAKVLLDILKPDALFGGKSQEGIPAIIYGAKERGEFLLRSLINQQKNSSAHYNIVGLISDEPRHQKVSIHGYSIIGAIDQFEEAAKRFQVKELLVAARVSGKKFEKLYSICRTLNIALRVIPSYLDGINKKIDVSSLRTIQIEDLLERDPVTIDYTKMERAFRGKRILITGAGGSIGSQLAEQLAEFNPAQMVFVDKGENYLFHLETKLSSFSSGMDLSYHCADITNLNKMTKLFEKYKPEYVFHAAAHKHVPMMERNKDEAIGNNIGGMKVVSTLSKKFGVKKFILISTDKAVNPSNVMGVTKRMCELYLQNIAEFSKVTQYMAVRFGNVLGSNGSVAPLFLKQIEGRGPVTVTHPDVERYFMTIPEAVLLILQAVTFGGQGELFLLDMGKPVKIVDLAEKMIRMAGFEPNKDIEIIHTGLRPGEKIKEELTSENENLEPTEHPTINRVRQDGKPWSNVEYVVDQALKNINTDPQGVYKNIVDWINHSGDQTDSKVINLKSVSNGKR